MHHFGIQLHSVVRRAITQFQLTCKFVSMAHEYCVTCMQGFDCCNQNKKVPAYLQISKCYFLKSSNAIFSNLQTLFSQIFKRYFLKSSNTFFSNLQTLFSQISKHYFLKSSNNTFSKSSNAFLKNVKCYFFYIVNS